MVELAHFFIDRQNRSVMSRSEFQLIPPERSLEASGDKPRWLRETLIDLQHVDMAQNDQVEEVLTKGTERWLAQLRGAAASRVLPERRQIISEFEISQLGRWRKALEEFELLLVWVQDLNLEFSSWAQSEVSSSCKEALIRLHRRACLTASEVLVLLKTGHAPGAQARWRTLHELFVVSYFLSQHCDEVAERYLHHDAVINPLKVAELYIRAGYYSEEDDGITELVVQRDKLVAKYGPEFKGDWGWAASVLKGEPNFARIEECVGFKRYRSLYKVASRSVHPNATQALSGIYSMAELTVPMIGPSNAGLADPAVSTLDSLTKITGVLLHQREDLIDGMAIRLLNRLYENAVQAFQEAHDRLVDEENTLWQDLTSFPAPNAEPID